MQLFQTYTDEMLLSISEGLSPR